MGRQASTHLDLKENALAPGLFYRPNEKLQMWQLDIAAVSYCFDEKEGFYWAIIFVSGESDIQKLKTECWSRWGKPDFVETSETGGTIVFEWRGEQTRMFLTHTSKLAIAQLDIEDTKRINRVCK